MNIGAPTYHFATITAAALVLTCVFGQEAIAKSPVQCGMASWYAHTGKTASGELADPNQLAAAHRTLPFGTQVEVENLRNGRTVIVRINDRGPFISSRLIDVTRAAAEKLGFLSRGLTQVRIRLLDGNTSSDNAACG